MPLVKYFLHIELWIADAPELMPLVKNFLHMKLWITGEPGVIPVVKYFLHIDSVTNGSKMLGWFRVQFRSGIGLLQGASTQNLLFKSQHFLFQLSIGVLIVSQHNLSMKYVV